MYVFMILPMFFSFIIFFNKKLLMLLLMEGLVVFVIFFFFVYFSCTHSSYSFMVFFSLFMVLESVFGLSLLIAVSRNSSILNLDVTFV